MGRRDLTSEAWQRELATQRERRRRNIEATRAYNRAWMRAHYTPRERPTPQRVERVHTHPIPVLDDHPLIIEAVGCLRAYERDELGTNMDAIAKDLVSEYVIARLDGRDGDEAMRRERARYRHDRAALVFGSSLTSGLER